MSAMDDKYSRVRTEPGSSKKSVAWQHRRAQKRRFNSLNKFNILRAMLNVPFGESVGLVGRYSRSLSMKGSYQRSMSDVRTLRGYNNI